MNFQDDLIPNDFSTCCEQMVVAEDKVISIWLNVFTLKAQQRCALMADTKENYKTEKFVYFSQIDW